MSILANHDSHPYVMGIAAKAADQTWGMNPFNPEVQPVAFEQWLDGWTDEQDEQRNFDALFTS